LGLRTWGNILVFIAILDFIKFEAWQKATDLAVKIRDVTSSFPAEERYGVVSQLRRAAVSIGSNTAEGFGRYTYPDKKHKYVEARGELIEVMSLLRYCERVRYISDDALQDLLKDCIVVHKLLNGLISSMNKLITSPHSGGPKSQVPSPKS
jgi:four helix bundle protein